MITGLRVRCQELLQANRLVSEDSTSYVVTELQTAQATGKLSLVDQPVCIWHTAAYSIHDVPMGSQCGSSMLLFGAWRHGHIFNIEVVCPVNKVLSPPTATVACFVSLDILLRYSSLFSSLLHIASMEKLQCSMPGMFKASPRRPIVMLARTSVLVNCGAFREMSSHSDLRSPLVR